jgi:hypothetical protein
MFADEPSRSADAKPLNKQSRTPTQDVSMPESSPLLALLTGTADDELASSASQTLRRVPAGTLRLPTGRIVACDPQVISGQEEAFVTSVGPGDYPVTLLLAKDDDSEWVAAAQIHFRNEPVARWETARTPEDGDLETVGYGVDNGTGCFIDAAVLPVAAQLADGNEEYGDTLADVEAAPDSDSVSVEISLGDAAGNLVAFGTGTGSGLYPSFFGLGADGQPVCLVTDFEVIDAE